MGTDDRDIFEVFDEIIRLLKENRENLSQVKTLLFKYEGAKSDALSGATEKMLAAVYETESDFRTKQKKTKGGKNEKNTLYCSFCGKSQHEVKKLIAGPSVFICEECTELCMTIIRAETSPKSTDVSGDEAEDKP